MVAGEIGEDASAKVQSCNALLVERVARNFHRGGTAAVFKHAREEFAEFQRGRRGELTRHAGSAVVDLNRSDQSATQTCERHQLLHEVRDGGLAVGSGDTDDFDGAAWTAVKTLRDMRGRQRGILRFAPGERRRKSIRPFAARRSKHSRCAARHRIDNERTAIGLGTGAGEEERTIAHAPRVLGQTPDIGVVRGIKQPATLRIALNGKTGNQGRKFHVRVCSKSSFIAGQAEVGRMRGRAPSR